MKNKTTKCHTKGHHEWQMRRQTDDAYISVCLVCEQVMKEAKE